MPEAPYSRFSGSDLILRDHLAIDRTVLATERTFLAYVRTALTFFVVGVSLLQLFDSRVLDAVAAILIVAGAGFLVIGGVRFQTMRVRLGRGAVEPGPGPDRPEDGAR